jgi:hypothetical protein
VPYRSKADATRPILEQQCRPSLPARSAIGGGQSPGRRPVQGGRAPDDWQPRQKSLALLVMQIITRGPRSDGGSRPKAARPGSCHTGQLEGCFLNERGFGGYCPTPVVPLLCCEWRSSPVSSSLPVSHTIRYSTRLLLLRCIGSGARSCRKKDESGNRWGEHSAAEPPHQGIVGSDVHLPEIPSGEVTIRQNDDRGTPPEHHVERSQGRLVSDHGSIAGVAISARRCPETKPALRACSCRPLSRGSPATAPAPAVSYSPGPRRLNLVLRRVVVRRLDALDR